MRNLTVKFEQTVIKIKIFDNYSFIYKRHMSYENKGAFKYYISKFGGRSRVLVTDTADAFIWNMFSLKYVVQWKWIKMNEKIVICSLLH